MKTDHLNVHNQSVIEQVVNLAEALERSQKRAGELEKALTEIQKRNDIRPLVRDSRDSLEELIKAARYLLGSLDEDGIKPAGTSRLREALIYAPSALVTLVEELQEAEKTVEKFK